jgi:hypothetical protein
VSDFDFDPVDFKSLFYYKDGILYWKTKKNLNKVAGSLKPTGYTVVEVFGKNIMAHRIIWAMHFGDTNYFIDHIDGNRSNNKIENLRIVNRTLNQWNRKISRNSSTGIKGVRLRKDNGKFEARLCVNKKRLVLGSFDDIELAEFVMQIARDHYHGEYANHG